MNEQQAQIHSEGTPKKRARNKKELFLDAFAEHGIVLKAAEIAGVDRRTVYKWLEHDEAFAFAYNQAKENAKDVIRAEIYRRAKEGWDEEVYQLGVFAGTVHKYSDVLLMFHAKALMKEYRERQQIEHSGPDGGPIQIQRNADLKNLSDEELDALEAIAKKAHGEGSSGDNT